MNEGGGKALARAVAAGRGTASDSVRGWRWLPGLAALTVGIALTAVVVDDDAWQSGHRWFRWMLQPVFHDLRVVYLGWSAAEAGFDPLAAPEHPFNYPRVILLGRFLGLHHVPPEIMGLTAAAVFLATLGWLLRPRVRWAAVLGAALVMSPPVLLIVERANLDAWAFVLVTWGMVAMVRSQAPGAALGGCSAVVAAALIKLYPVVSLLAGSFGWRGHRRWWTLGGLAVFVALTLLRLDEVALVLHKTTRGIEPAYGYAVAASRYQLEAVRPHQTADVARHFIDIAMPVSFGVYALTVAGAALAGWRGGKRNVTAGWPACDRALFWSGALVFAGTFGLGTNWSYRLVFLLLCVPALCAAVNETATRRWALATLTCLTLTIWAPFHLPLGWFGVGQVVQWTLVGLLSWGAIATFTGRDDRVTSRESAN